MHMAQHAAPRTRPPRPRPYFGRHRAGAESGFHWEGYFISFVRLMGGRRYQGVSREVYDQLRDMERSGDAQTQEFEPAWPPE